MLRLRLEEWKKERGVKLSGAEREGAGLAYDS
jgi:hypothetical protein